MKFGRLFKLACGGALLIVAATLWFVWMECRVYVPADQCLVLISKVGDPQPPGQRIAEAGQKGIQRETLGPGRYFLNPWVWSWELHPLVKISAGDPATWREQFPADRSDTGLPTLVGEWPQVGLLYNRVGQPAPDGAAVVEEGYEGIQRRVLTPGVYRINPHVYEVLIKPATVVPVGYCGVVTSQFGELPGTETVEETGVAPDGQPVKALPKVVQKLAEAGQRGVRRHVLQPGIYYLNPLVEKVELVQVGFNQITQHKAKDVSTHITFPSKDGFTIDVDVTVVWGRHPAHVAEMLNRFGEVEKIKELILAQMRSICRNLGSEYDSTDFIRGEERELYQRKVTQTLQRVCRERDIEILIALIHNIEVRRDHLAGQPAARGPTGGGAQPSPSGGVASADLKTTIQRGFIAREQELTKQAQRETAVVRAELETAKVAVEIAREQITADTRKKVAELKADGQKKSQEIGAQRDLEVAAVEKQIAELDAEAKLVMGKAQAEVDQLRYAAEAQGRRLMIDAFGSGAAYNLYTFAQGFTPESIRLIFAGEGTFWTDLQRLEDAGAMKLLQGPQNPPQQPAPAAGPRQ
ncbi:MAG: SPFH domain-containing protein [Planctomycetota bacterium]